MIVTGKKKEMIERIQNKMDFFIADLGKLDACEKFVFHIGEKEVLK